MLSFSFTHTLSSLFVAIFYLSPRPSSLMSVCMLYVGLSLFVCLSVHPFVCLCLISLSEASSCVLLSCLISCPCLVLSCLCLVFIILLVVFSSSFCFNVLVDKSAKVSTMRDGITYDLRQEVYAHAPLQGRQHNTTTQQLNVVLSCLFCCIVLFYLLCGLCCVVLCCDVVLC